MDVVLIQSRLAKLSLSKYWLRVIPYAQYQSSFCAPGHLSALLFCIFSVSTLSDIPDDTEALKGYHFV